MSGIPLVHARPQPDAENLLARWLEDTPRRYRLPALPPLPSDNAAPGQPPGTVLALVIEHARRALEAGQAPADRLQRLFVTAMDALIREAMQPDGGDPAYQAMVLRHQAASVREYDALMAGMLQDRRLVLALVNALAHPGKLQGRPVTPWRETLASLHDAASSETWDQLADIAGQLLGQAAPEPGPDSTTRLQALLAAPALQRLRDIHALREDPQVGQYLALQELQGPRAGSRAAAEQGAVARRRGMDVETLATLAMQGWAQCLNTASNDATAYRVVSSMRVPGALASAHTGGKTEWDVVLLKQAPGSTESPCWDIRLLVEAKASVDAISSDLPRLLRGLRLMEAADPARNYPFPCREGGITVRGASLQSLKSVDDDTLASKVMYCSDDNADTPPRLLGAASRMQLLSAPESMAHAVALGALRPVSHAPGLALLWRAVLHEPRWKAVRLQYPLLQRGRELMVHVEDLKNRPD